MPFFRGQVFYYPTPIRQMGMFYCERNDKCVVFPQHTPPFSPAFINTYLVSQKKKKNFLNIVSF